MTYIAQLFLCVVRDFVNVSEISPVRKYLKIEQHPSMQPCHQKTRDGNDVWLVFARDGARRGRITRAWATTCILNRVDLFGCQRWVHSHGRQRQLRGMFASFEALGPRVLEGVVARPATLFIPRSGGRATTEFA